MAVANTAFNLVDMLQNGLEYELKKALTNRIVRNKMKEIEKDIRAEIEPIVQRISIGPIEHMQDFARLRDELHVYVHMEEVSNVKTRNGDKP